MAANQHYLLQLIGFGLVLITVGILAVGHAQAPHSQNAVDIISHPGILLFMTGRQQPRDGILLKKETQNDSTTLFTQLLDKEYLSSDTTTRVRITSEEIVVSILALPRAV